MLKNYELSYHPGEETDVEEEIIYEMDYKSKLGLLGLSNMMVIRMQCVDFVHRNSMWKTFHDIILHDSYWMLVRGLAPIMLGQALGESCLGVATHWQNKGRQVRRRRLMKEETIPVHQDLLLRYVWLIPGAMTFLLMHPMQVIGMHVVYARHNKKVALQSAMRNTF